MNLTLEQIAKACDGDYIGSDNLRSICVTQITSDSRQIKEGGLFIPIVGTRVDGHNFIPQVIQNGACCTLSEVELEELKVPYIKVESTLDAIKKIAAYYLEQLAIPVVGITGSVGKTSTKEMIASVLAKKYKVLKTLGNFNNELGLPFTIFRLREGDEVAVLEMGISDFGEMSRLAQITKPDIGVITNIGICHLENLGDRDGVLKAKTELFQYLREDGRAILNGDDDKLKSVSKVKDKEPIFFGMDGSFGYYATQVENKGLKGMYCNIHTPKGAFEVHIKIPGIHMVYNALAATAVGVQLGLMNIEIKDGIESCEPVGGRNHIIEKNDMVILDDCYNANPISMKSGIDVLKMSMGRKVAILGDMGELGEDEVKHHKEIGFYVAKEEIDVLIAVGPLSKYLAEAAKSVKNTKTKVYYFQEKEELLKEIHNILEKEDTILIKASHFMGFETIVQELSK